MDESLQQILALLIVLVVVGFELRRRWLKRKRGKIGCDDCGPKDNKPLKEAPLRFYKRP